MATMPLSMQQPPGFESQDKSLVCWLHKAIYGLKQAPRARFELLSSALRGLGFVSSKCDPSLSTIKTSTYTIVMLVYVDDIIIIGSSQDHIRHIIHKLNDDFSLKQLGDLEYFLGIKVHHQSNGSLLLSQSKYIRDLLAKANMSKPKGLPTPMVSNLKLSKYDSDYMVDPSFYRSIVRALQYATITRHEISYAVNK